jgi:ubiquinone/menaquinone biosynthesis C-methylase UbiE
MNRVVLHALSVGFSAMLAFLLLFPKAARSKPVRWLITFFFGRMLAQRYDKVISVYGSAYGLALSRGLDAASALVRRPIDTIVDCGAGTGFVTQALAKRYPNARIICVDVVPAMLLQARTRFKESGIAATVICGDISIMPLPDACADLVVAQNTIPYLQEFARICAAGGAVIFADSSARLVTGVAARAAAKIGTFGKIESGTTETGFYLCAERNATI